MREDIIYVVNEEIDINNVDEKLVIIEPMGKEIFVLDKREAEVFQLFNGTNTVLMIGKQLENEFEETYIKEEFFEFLEELIEKKLLVESKR